MKAIKVAIRPATKELSDFIAPPQFYIIADHFGEANRNLMKSRLLSLYFLWICLLCTGAISAQYNVQSGTGLEPFIDISGSGDALDFLGDDGERGVILPFDFTFFGVEYPAPVNLVVGSNGGLLVDETIGATSDIPPSNTALPSGIGPAIFPLWEDLNQGGAGNIYVASTGIAPFRTFIIQWEMYKFLGNENLIKFQVQLDESSNRIVFVLEDIETDVSDDDNFGADATVGIDGAENGVVQFSFNEILQNELDIIFDDPNDDVIIVTTLEPVSLAAITNVNVTLNDRCEAMITPEMILSGNFDVDDDDIVPDASAYGIVVMDSDTTNGPTVDGCGTFTWTVTADPELISGLVTAWGYVTAEDKTPPQLLTLPKAPDDLLCNDLEDVSLLELDSDVDRCFIINGSTGAPKESSFIRSKLGRVLLEGGGLPVFFDGCSDIEVCATDVVDEGDGCGNITITRYFTASDGDCPSVSGEENESITVSYEITLYRPSIDHVEEGSEPLPFNCTEYSVDDPNPRPRASDYPVASVPGVGQFRLNRPTCNLAAEYTDGPRVVTCPNTYKFVRTFRVFDWCKPGQTKVFTQVVKVGDFSPPKISEPSRDQDFDGANDDEPFFFTTNDGCAANFVVPTAEVSDSCSANIETVVFIYPSGNLEAFPIGPFPMGGIAVGIPPGDHIMQYVATDDCGNKGTLDVEFRVGDRTAPVAICEDGLNISLNANGIAVIEAADIDGGSYDDCGLMYLDIACVDENNEPLADDGDAGDDPEDPELYYDPTLTVDCDDLGEKMIGLRVTDAAGNVNYCWLMVLIEDKFAPICVPPASMKINCEDLLGDFPQDLNDAFADDPAGTAALLDDQFGAANGIDNCETVIPTQTVEDKRNSCGKGEITRTFSFEDGQGLTNLTPCKQVITVELVHDYTISFPGDEESENCVEPDYMGVSFEERACDLITVSSIVDTFSATAEECYKLRITYEVLNWCEYNGEDDAYIIPRDADDDDDLSEVTYLHVLPGEDDGVTTDDIAELDRDADWTNNRTTGDKSFIAFLDTGDGGILDGSAEAGYGLDGSRGSFLYRQFIKVYDDEAPELSVIRPDGPGLDNDGDCLGNIELSFTVGDDCSPASVGIQTLLDLDLTDHNGDSEFTLNEFEASEDVTDHIVSLGGGDYNINLDDLPIGRHALRVSATDGCGNTAIELIIFEIQDNKAPTPICINGLTVTLMPDGEGGGMAAVWANDFVASASTDCSGPVSYAIYRATDASLPGFEPNPLDTGLVLNCDDDATTIIRIYAIDPQGQSDYCEATLLVQLHQEGMCDGSAGSLSGRILTELGGPMQGVEVSVTGENTVTLFTDDQGNFDVSGLATGGDYTLIPYLNTGHMDGVSTFDILTISRHILGIAHFTNPYQFIAADANRSQEITVIDLIVLRRLILGLDDDFENNTSWRFIDNSYSFPEATNPWAEVFPEVANFNNLIGSVSVDFMGIKVGDLNGDSALSGSASPRSGAASLVVNESQLSAMETTAIEVFANQELMGLQATLDIREGVELVDVLDGQAGADVHFGYRLLERGMLTFSFEAAGEVINTEEPLFTLLLKSDTDQRLSDAIVLSDRFIRSEAYTPGGDLRGLNWLENETIDAAGKDYLYPNYPNPVAVDTRITFDVSKAGLVNLIISDANGRQLLTRRIDAHFGTNNVVINRDELGLSSGVLTYTLSGDTFSASRQMVVVK